MKGGHLVIKNFNEFDQSFDMDDIEINEGPIKVATLEIELREFLEENDILNIVLQLDGKNYKKIQIKRR